MKLPAQSEATNKLKILPNGQCSAVWPATHTRSTPNQVWQTVNLPKNVMPPFCHPFGGGCSSNSNSPLHLAAGRAEGRKTKQKSHRNPFTCVPNCGFLFMLPFCFLLRKGKQSPVTKQIQPTSVQYGRGFVRDEKTQPGDVDGDGCATANPASVRRG